MEQKSRQLGFAFGHPVRLLYQRMGIVSFGCLSFLLLTFVCCNPCADAADVSAEQKTPEQMESEIKTAFIYNFMKFIQWPPEKDIAAGDIDKTMPIQIAILGKNPFTQAFQQILDKNIQGRPIELVLFESFEQFSRSYPNKQSAADSYQKTYASTLHKCHLLFICDSEKNSVEELTAIIKGQGLVTVSDIEDFAAHYGMIGFVMEKNKVRFEVNLDAAGSENIRISSQLLGLAKRVYKKE